MTGTIAVAAAPVPASYPLALALRAIVLGAAGWLVLRGRRLATRAAT